jgi:hypothetical protein
MVGEIMVEIILHHISKKPHSGDIMVGDIMVEIIMYHISKKPHSGDIMVDRMVEW